MRNTAFLFLLGLLLSACSKNNCEQLNLTVIEKADALNKTYAKSDCEAYKVALQAYINEGCEAAASFQKELDKMVCP